jgi:serine/threonine protein phosphatase PrpC
VKALQIFSKTDRGRVRTDNQDAYFAGKITDDSVFAVVCDGMGGANAGNVASELAVRHISEYVIRSYRDGMDMTDTEKTLKNAIVSANISLYDKAVNNAELAGMGTTAVAAFVKDGTAVIAHVGDSRIYLVNGEIKQLTRDHSVVQSLIESGKITPEDAKVHPRKNVITRALGAEENVAVDSDCLNLSNGDTLLLCSDGLTNFLDDKDILKVFQNNDISAVAERLVEEANENGGGDNITVVTVTK